jgi:cystathionine beta-lyase family protein involved in aluminum resistance
MQTFPLESLTVAAAKKLQFRLVDIVTQHFSGSEILTQGDLGVLAGFNRPSATAKAEQVLARFFHAEAAALVRGAGSAAIRCGLGEILSPGGTLMIHDAPVYPTTQVAADNMGLHLAPVDFHDRSAVRNALDGVDAVLIQHTRQKPDDHYRLADVIDWVKSARPAMPVLVDDNYAVMKAPAIGVECNADLSAFSLFKLLGPEGVGCVVGCATMIDSIRKKNYSGGGQVQGHEALAALRGLAYAPVALAIQAEVVNECCERLNAGEIPGVRQAAIANAQSKVLLVEFEQPVAAAVLQAAEKLGAAPHPVGAESKYEFAPMFYRLSGTFLADDPGRGQRMIRINPMRCGADTVLRILRSALAVS